MQTRDPNNARGVDVSHYQGVIDWMKVRAAGYSFAILKTTEGKGMTDDRFISNVAGAKRAGILVGAYHFCRATTVQEAIQEAEYFCRAIGDGSSLDLMPALDIESTEGKTKANISAICHAWINRVREITGLQSILYTYFSFAYAYLDDSLSGVPLWLARYDTEQPEDAAGWKHWTFLQYTDKGTVPGISGPVDINEYNGSVEDLNGLKISKADADKVIGLLGEAFQQGITRITLPDGSVSIVDQDEIHRLANVQRTASGQQTT